MLHINQKKRQDSAMISRRPRGFIQTTIILLLLVCTSYVLYLNNLLQVKIKGMDSKVQRYQSEHQALSSQLQVVYEGRSRLEDNLQKEKGAHQNTKDELQQQKEAHEGIIEDIKQAHKEKYQALIEEHANVKESLLTSQKEVEELKEQKEYLEKQKQDGLRQISNYNLDHKEVQEKHKKLQEEYNELSNDHKHNLASNADLAQRLQQAQVSLDRFTRLQQALREAGTDVLDLKHPHFDEMDENSRHLLFSEVGGNDEVAKKLEQQRLAVKSEDNSRQAALDRQQELKQKRDRQIATQLQNQDDHDNQQMQGDAVQQNLAANAVAQQTDKPVEQHQVDPNQQHLVNPNQQHLVDPNQQHLVDPNQQQLFDPNQQQLVDPNQQHLVDPNQQQLVDPNQQQPVGFNQQQQQQQDENIQQQPDANVDGNPGFSQKVPESKKDGLENQENLDLHELVAKQVVQDNNDVGKEKRDARDGLNDPLARMEEVARSQEEQAQAELNKIRNEGVGDRRLNEDGDVKKNEEEALARLGEVHRHQQKLAESQAEDLAKFVALKQEKQQQRGEIYEKEDEENPDDPEPDPDANDLQEDEYEKNEEDDEPDNQMLQPPAAQVAQEQQKPVIDMPEVGANEAEGLDRRMQDNYNEKEYEDNKKDEDFGADGNFENYNEDEDRDAQNEDEDRDAQNEDKDAQNEDEDRDAQNEADFRHDRAAARAERRGSRHDIM